MKLRGHLYWPGSSERTEATLARDGNGAYRLVDVPGKDDEDVTVAEATPPLAGIPRTVVLADGRRLVPVRDLPPGFLDDGIVSPGRWVDWLERVSPLRIVLLVIILVLALAGMRAGIPVAADLAAELIPEQVEAEIGRQAFDSMDELLLSPTDAEAPQLQRIRNAFRELAGTNGLTELPEILFRQSEGLGANAFAFPGGPVLVTDQLLELLDDKQVMAVLAHEVGHVELRHGLRQVLRTGGLILLVSVATGFNESIVEELATLAITMVELGYSRDFEREADAYAARFLETGGLSAGDLADALHVLTQDCGEACQGELDWLSTHPSTNSRIKALRSPRSGTD